MKKILLLAVAVFSASWVISEQLLFATSTDCFIDTVAGNGEDGYAGDGGHPLEAALSAPAGLAFHPITGELYIADSGNHTVRKIVSSSPDSVTIVTVAGNGRQQGYNGDNRPATEAWLTIPREIVFDALGNLYIAEGRRVRKVEFSSGTITTYAGTGTAGCPMDGTPANEAPLSLPLGVTFDSSGNFFISDGICNRVYKVAASSGLISTVAGGGTSITVNRPALEVLLDYPVDIAFDSADNLFIVNNRTRILRVDHSTHMMSAFVSNMEEPSGIGYDLDSYYLFEPRALAFDSANNLYFTDSWGGRIWKVAPDRTIRHVAGNGVSGFSGDGGNPTAAQFSALGWGASLSAVSVPSWGEGASNFFYVSDTENHRVRKIYAIGVSDCPDLSVPAGYPTVDPAPLPPPPLRRIAPPKTSVPSPSPKKTK